MGGDVTVSQRTEPRSGAGPGRDQQASSSPAARRESQRYTIPFSELAVASIAMPRVALVEPAAAGTASTCRPTGTTAAAATAPATTPRSAPAGDVCRAHPAGSRAATSAASPLPSGGALAALPAGPGGRS